MSTGGDDEAICGVANIEVDNPGVDIGSREGDSLNDVLNDSGDESEVESLNTEAQAALEAAFEAIESGKDDSVLKDVVVPTMGQLVSVNGTKAIICGGQPNESWTSLMSPTGSYRSPLQLRTLNKVSAKDYKYRYEKISNLTVSKESNLVLVGDIMRKMELIILLMSQILLVKGIHSVSYRIMLS